MFKNQALQVSLVNPKKAAKTAPTTTDVTTIDLNEIGGMMKDQVTHAAIAVVSVYAAVISMKTVSTIAINAAPKRY